MSESLPQFRYHPDPIATGSVRRQDVDCVCCGTARAFVYTGPAYCDRDIDEELCPWCIADGSAHDKLGVSFTDRSGIGAYGLWGEVSEEVRDEVEFRTPGFSGWQQEKWWTCCGDAGAFLGAAGCAELQGEWAAALPAIRDEAGYDEEEWALYLEHMDKQGSPTAYVFRCERCGKLGGYSDCN